MGIQYPFGASSSAVNGLPSLSIPNEVDDFHALDTNNDGVIDNKDGNTFNQFIKLLLIILDPYTPYYPGDDVVDWVALSLYHFPTLSEGNFNPTPDEFYQGLTGTMNPDVNPGANFEVRNFYKRFAEDRNKPLMIPESGSPWLSNAPTGPIVIPLSHTFNFVFLAHSSWNNLLISQTKLVEPNPHTYNPSTSTQIQSILEFRGN